MAVLINKGFEQNLIKQKGATLAEINKHLYDLEVFCKSLKRITFSEQDLEERLDAGVGNILAGVGQDFLLDIRSDYIVAQHKNAVYNASVGAYTGDLRTALFIGANGIGMGYNRKSDGNWVTSIILDGTTGNAVFTGELAVGSLVASNVVLSGGARINSLAGETLTSIQNNAQIGANIDYALKVTGTTILKGVLQPDDSGAIRVGSITWNPTTGALTGGTGIAMTEWGIIGASGGTPTFSIEASTGTATFAGNVNTGGQVYATGNTFNPGIGTNSCIAANTSASGRKGITSWSSLDIAVQAHSGSGTALEAFTAGAVTASFGNFSSSNIALQLNAGRIQKSNEAGQFVSIYNTGTNALIATYRYAFHN